MLQSSPLQPSALHVSLQLSALHFSLVSKLPPGSGLSRVCLLNRLAALVGYLPLALYVFLSLLPSAIQVPQCLHSSSQDLFVKVAPFLLPSPTPLAAASFLC
ncbi:hypothetical protein M758_UG162600 [Ceratodon purpureus]|nr:hypothetical protein M758_UG162600 [Ceratodon purpureus]